MRGGERVVRPNKLGHIIYAQRSSDGSHRYACRAHGADAVSVCRVRVARDIKFMAKHAPRVQVGLACVASDIRVLVYQVYLYCVLAYTWYLSRRWSCDRVRCEPEFDSGGRTAGGESRRTLSTTPTAG